MSAARRRATWPARIAAAVLGIFLVDAVSGHFFRTNGQSCVIVVRPRSGTPDLAIVVFPGFVMPGDTLTRAFDQFLPMQDALIVVNYAERGVNTQQIWVNVMAALRRLKPRKVLVYGASMGGMVGKLFLDDYRRAGAPYGKVEFVLDTAPAEKADVRRPNLLFNLSCWYRGGYLSSAVWATVASLLPEPPIEPAASPQLVRAAHHAGAWIGMPALTTQACFIGHFRQLRAGELVDVVSRLRYVQSNHPGDDPLIRISQAQTAWRTAFPGLETVTCRERPGRYHLPLVEYPKATMNTILATEKS